MKYIVVWKNGDGKSFERFNTFQEAYDFYFEIKRAKFEFINIYELVR